MNLRRLKVETISYPEHEKLKKISKESQLIGDFLEWLADEKKLSIAQFGTASHMIPCDESKEALLGEFFGIDRKKLEEEKRAMLKSLEK